MSRNYNFSAGPAMISEAVLTQARDQMLNWNDTGMSVMEMSHRGKEYLSIATQAETDLRDLLNIPEHYKVLFLQGGASTQFSAIPMNLLDGNETADYINTGTWSKKAIKEAQRYCDVNVVASSENSDFLSIPPIESWNLNEDAAYMHYTPNETISGVEFHWIPEVGDVPLVADMSSTLLSRPLNVEKYGLIYAGAQKNIGPAGLTLVIVREDLIGKALKNTPAMMDYAIQSKAGSMYNTPPTYSWFLAGLVFKWLKKNGGLEAMAEINERKSVKLYNAIDTSDFYKNSVNINCRSWMNVPFTLGNSDLDSDFLSQAAAQGLVTLKGHSSVGGMRASIYNAMPEAGIDALISFMVEFEAKYG
ncbi:MAG: 3-phosphoserine/phosphohydroxythreonine transaminase [Cocleimonas sp.]|nr:3-phosphoserine/phosphohydroxythreonine transaminase [Cocleimonas sp.]